MRFFSFALLFVVLFSCRENRKEFYGECGDGVKNKGEECDRGALNSNFEPDGCRTNCQKAWCGDGIKDSNEQCDTAQTGGLSCSDLGFDRGILRCNDNCTFDTRLCSTCGDGIAQPAEECDGNDLGGGFCTQFGFSGGSLACHPSCSYDYSGCTGGCGNGIIEGVEECDRDALPDTSCQEWGFAGGILRCSASCRLDYSLCTNGCGNGIIEPGETCDDGNFAPLDGCYGCREPSGNYEPLLQLDFAHLPVDTDIADLDGDGVPDLLITLLSEDLLTGAVIWTSGAEDHQIPRTLLSGPFLFARTVRTRSGETGILAISPGMDELSRYYWAPSFGESFSEFPGSDWPSFLLVTDLDGEPGDEVVMSAMPSQHIMLVDPEAGSLAGINGLMQLPHTLERIDFNQDGRWDLAVVRQSSQMLSLLQWNNGQWVHTGARWLGGRPFGMAVTDIDGDGRDDLAVTDMSLPKLYLLRGMPDGPTNRVEFPLESTAGAITSGQLDSASPPDLFIALPRKKAVVVYTGNGNWGFSRQFTFSPCETPEQLKLVDLDQDGFFDLFFTCRHDRRLHVLRAIPH